MYNLAQIQKAIDATIEDLLETPEHIVSSRILVTLADAYNSLRTISLKRDARLHELLLPVIEIHEDGTGKPFIKQTRSQIIERLEQLRRQ